MGILKSIIGELFGKFLKAFWAKIWHRARFWFGEGMYTINFDVETKKFVRTNRVPPFYLQYVEVNDT